jgi:hypothetical protein
LKFTYEIFKIEAPFLDLWILKNQDRFHTRTHQKKLNLHLYLPANSAHPPGVLKGLIFGLIKKYSFQTSKPEELKKILKAFYRRLLARGYSQHVIKPLFLQALQPRVSKTSNRFAVMKLPFDPNGPQPKQLRSLLRFNELKRKLEPYDLDRLVLCFKKPRTLRNHLCPTTLALNSPTPAELLPVQESGVKP